MSLATVETNTFRTRLDAVGMTLHLAQPPRDGKHVPGSNHPKGVSTHESAPSGVKENGGRVESAHFSFAFESIGL